MVFKLNVWVNLGGSVSKKFFFVEEGRPNYTFSNLELKGTGSSQYLHLLDNEIESLRPFTDKWAGFFFGFLVLCLFVLTPMR